MPLERRDRIRLIQECAEVLAGDWEEACFLLQEFGFPWEQERGQSVIADVRQNLAQGSADDLIDLHAHLYPESTQPQPVEPHRIWQAGSLRLFLSHLSADKEFASELKQALSPWGVDVFVAHEDIEPTREWMDEIEEALASCHALLAYMTPQFHGSLYTDQEIGFCVGRRVLVIPVRAGSDPYGLIMRYQALTAPPTAPALAKPVVQVLVGHATTKALMAEPLVRALEWSGSYDGTRAVMSMIESVDAWTPELLRRMEEAARHNNQVSEAVIRRDGGEYQPVPDRVTELVERFSR